MRKNVPKAEGGFREQGFGFVEWIFLSVIK